MSFIEVKRERNLASVKPSSAPSSAPPKNKVGEVLPDDGDSPADAEEEAMNVEIASLEKLLHKKQEEKNEAKRRKLAQIHALKEKLQALDQDIQQVDKESASVGKDIEELCPRGKTTEEVGKERLVGPVPTESLETTLESEEPSIAHGHNDKEAVQQLEANRVCSASESARILRLPLDVVQMIEEALKPADIPVEERNKLYVKMGRHFEGEDIPASVLAEYAQCRKGDKFQLLKKWIKDPTWASVRLQESQTMTEGKHQDNVYTWRTRGQLMGAYNAWGNTEGTAFVDNLIKGAKAKAHPIRKKEKEFTLYRVFKETVDSEIQRGERSQSMQLSGSVGSAQAGMFAQQGLAHAGLSMLAPGGVGSSNDKGSGKGRTGKIKNEKTDEVGNHFEESAGETKPTPTKGPKKPTADGLLVMVTKFFFTCKATREKLEQVPGKGKKINAMCDDFKEHEEKLAAIKLFLEDAIFGKKAMATIAATLQTEVVLFQTIERDLKDARGSLGEPEISKKARIKEMGVDVDVLSETLQLVM